jgi:flagellar protein FlgJ
MSAKSKYSVWLAANYPAAEQVTAGTGIFPEILLSQAIIESAKNGHMPGTSLAKLHNNYFGIKTGKSWKGAAVSLKTGEFTKAGAYQVQPDFFRVYKTPADSFKDYVQLLHNKRYAAARAATTERAQAQELQAAGYSTNPEYGNIVSALAETIKGAGAYIKANPGKAGAGAAGAAAAALAITFYYVSQKQKHGR